MPLKSIIDLCFPSSGAGLSTPFAGKGFAKHFKELCAFFNAKRSSSCSKLRGTFQKDEALSLRNLGPPGQVDVRRWSVFVFEVHSGSQMEGPS